MTNLRPYIKVIWIPLVIQTINYFLRFIFTEFYHFLYIPIVVILTLFMSYQIVWRLKASIWLSTLLGSTILILDPLFSVVAVNFFHIFIYSDVNTIQEQKEGAWILFVLSIPIALVVSAILVMTFKAFHKVKKS